MRKRKVIHLISSLAMGGAETLVTDYALKINKDLFDIVIVTISPSQNTVNEKKLKDAGIKVIYLGDKVTFPKTTNMIKRIINKICRYILFYKLVNKENPQIIHSHLGTNNYIIPINTKRKNIKLFHTIHSEVKIMFEKANRRLPTIYCVRHKGMLPIALHSKMQLEANDFFNINSTLVMPNAVDINRFANVNVNRNEILESLNIEKNAFVLGHVGRFVPQKNHKFLVKVFADLKEKRPSAHLILVGTGYLEKQVRDQVEQLGLQDSVSFLGSRGDIPELLNAMDVFVFPSRYEGFGNVLIEAQAAGVKCVASDSIPRDAFVTNLVMLLSLNDSIKTWSQAIIKNDYPNNITGNLEKHDIKNVIKKLQNIYLSVDS